MKKHEIYEQYFDLYQFLAKFNVATYGTIEDRDAVWGKHTPVTVSPARYKVLRQQADALLAMKPFPSRAIIDILHRYFEHESDVRPWFENILRLLKERVDQEYPGQA